MSGGPSKIAEAVVAVLVPPACRDEIVGDLHERFTSSRQYALDALRTVPLVVISRIRRTSDPQILLIQAFALYMSFLSAAWLADRAVLSEQWGPLRLAIPPAMVILALILDDVYANPGCRSAINMTRGPVIGVIVALVSQEMFRLSSPDLALPRWIAFYGCAMGFLLSSSVRIWFPPVTDHLQGTSAPAQWLKQASGSPGNLQTDIRVLKGIFIIVTIAIIGTWMIVRTGSAKPIVPALLAAYLVWKRG